MNEYQRKVIRTLKGLEPYDTAGVSTKEIPVINEKNSKVGLMRPIDSLLANNEQVIDSLAAWRRRFSRFFFTQFEVTAERTKAWLNDVVIKDDTRILFLVMDAANNLVGHVGACHITEESAELDNFIRGTRGGDPKVMLLSGLSTIGWLYSALNIEKIQARVIANNYRTLSVYEAAGCFERIGPRTLATAGNEHSPGTDKYWVMVLDIQKFLSRYPWMVTTR